MEKGAQTMRVLIDPALDGPTNMGRDDALLEGVRAGQTPMTLRFYSWSQPTVSLGALQSFTDWLRVSPPAGALQIVRRRTGGGALLHDSELTYSLTVPRNLVPDRSPGDLYCMIHEAIADVLHDLGVPTEVRPVGTVRDPLAQRREFWCFNREYNYDVLAGGGKIAGSAQRRTVEAVLQHGSVVLANYFRQHPASSVRDFADPPEVIGLARAISSTIGRKWSVQPKEGAWLPAELEAANELADQHRTAGWLWRR